MSMTPANGWAAQTAARIAGAKQIARRMRTPLLWRPSRLPARRWWSRGRLPAGARLGNRGVYGDARYYQVGGHHGDGMDGQSVDYPHEGGASLHFAQRERLFEKDRKSTRLNS